jgi:hypothetical protein
MGRLSDRSEDLQNPLALNWRLRALAVVFHYFARSVTDRHASVSIPQHVIFPLHLARRRTYMIGLRLMWIVTLGGIGLSLTACNSSN